MLTRQQIIKKLRVQQAFQEKHKLSTGERRGLLKALYHNIKAMEPEIC